MAEKVEIVIGAKDEFSATFNKLKDSAKQVESAFAPLTKHFKSLLAFTAAAAGGYGFYALIKATVDQQAAFAGLEKRLGLSTELMSKLGFYAEKSGGQLEDMTTSLQFMLRNTSEAAAGNETMRKTLRELGLSIENLRKLSPDEIFKAYVAAFGNVKNKADQARLAMEVFGRGGGAMLSFLSQGEEGFKKISAEADRFGATLSSQSAYNAKEFKVSLKLLEIAISEVREELFERFIPYFTSAFKTAAYWVADNRVKVAAWGEAFLRILGKVAEGLVWFAAKATDTFYAVGAAANKFSLKSNQESIKSYIGEIENLQKKSDELSAEMESGSWDKTGQRYKELQENLVKTNTRMESLKVRVKELNNENLNLASEFSENAERAFNTDTVNEFFNTVKKGMDDWKASGVADVPEITAPAMKLGTSKEQETAAKKLKEDLKALQNEWDNYYATETQKAETWYKQAQDKFKGHTEALDQIYQIYLAKKFEGYQKEIEADRAKYEAIKAQQDQLFSEFENLVLNEEEQLRLWYEKQVIMAEENQATIALIEEVYAKKRQDLQDKQLNQQLESWATVMGAMSTISAQFGKKAFKLSQGLAIVQALMSAYVAFNEALKNPPGPPYTIPLAAAVLALALAQVVKIRSQKPPAAKKGVDLVPRDQTYQLHAGERVVPAETNKDLREFLAAGGGAVSIGAISIELPNVRDRDSFIRMSDREWQDVLEYRVVPNLRKLAGAGVRV